MATRFLSVNRARDCAPTALGAWVDGVAARVRAPRADVRAAVKAAAAHPDGLRLMLLDMSIADGEPTRLPMGGKVLDESGTADLLTPTFAEALVAAAEDAAATAGDVESWKPDGAVPPPREEAVATLYGATEGGGSVGVVVKGVRPWVRVELPLMSMATVANANAIAAWVERRLYGKWGAAARERAELQAHGAPPEPLPTADGYVPTVTARVGGYMHFYGWEPSADDATTTARHACVTLAFDSVRAASAAGRLLSGGYARVDLPSGHAKVALTLVDGRIPTLTKWLADARLVPCSWVAVRGFRVLGADDGGTRALSTQVEVGVHLGEAPAALEPLDEKTFMGIAPLVVQSFDGEMGAPSGAFPLPFNGADATAQLGIVYKCAAVDREGRAGARRVAVLLAVADAIELPLDGPAPAPPDTAVWLLPDAAALLEAYRALVVGVDVDVETGWNTMGFDYRFLMDEYDQACLPPRARLSEAGAARVAALASAWARRHALATRIPPPAEYAPLAVLLGAARARLSKAALNEWADDVAKKWGDDFVTEAFKASNAEFKRAAAKATAAAGKSGGCEGPFTSLSALLRRARAANPALGVQTRAQAAAADAAAKLAEALAAAPPPPAAKRRRVVVGGGGAADDGDGDDAASVSTSSSSEAGGLEDDEEDAAAPYRQRPAADDDGDGEVEDDAAAAEEDDDDGTDDEAVVDEDAKQDAAARRHPAASAKIPEAAAAYMRQRLRTALAMPPEAVLDWEAAARAATEEQRRLLWRSVAAEFGASDAIGEGVVAALQRPCRATHGRAPLGYFMSRVLSERARLVGKRMASAGRGDNTFLYFGVGRVGDGRGAPGRPLSGRVPLDLMQLIKDDKKPEDNSLKFAAASFLPGHRGKDDLPVPVLLEHIASGDPHKLGVVGAYWCVARERNARPRACALTLDLHPPSAASKTAPCPST